MALDELFFQSIDTIARSVMSENSQYDVTWFCTITDNSNASIGVYTVEYQNQEYKVQSENTSYLVGDHVKVNIPNNNIDGIKFITGRYTPMDSSKPVTYVAPLSEILPIRTEVVSQVYDITANGPMLLQTIHEFTSLPRELDMCDSIVITANFQTLFTDVIKGEYGLRITIVGDSLVTGRENVAVEKIFTSKDFIGDPYQLKIFSEQQIRIDISSLFNIKKIIIELCQDNLFETSEGRLTPSPVPDIRVRDITVYFGTSALKAREIPFEIKCYDSQYYNSDNEGNIKEIRSYWHNYNEQGAYIGYSNGVVNPEVDIKDNRYVYDELSYEAQRNYVTELSSINNAEQPLNESGLIIKRNNTKLVTLQTKVLEQLGANYLTASLSNAERLLGIGTLSDQRTTLETIIKEIDEYSKSVEAKYKAVINFAIKRVVGKKDMDIPEIPNPLWNERAAVAIKNLRTSLYDTSKLAPANKSYYETNTLPPIEENILKKIDKIIQEATECEAEISKLLEEFKLQFDIDEYWTPYIPSTLEEFENKYCIYWYRYDGINAINIDEHGGANWSRIPELDNIGLVLAASGGLKPNGELEDPTYLAKVALDRERPQAYERFKAIMFFNHIPYVSQELVFENQGQEYQKTQRDLLSLKIVNQGESKDSYQFYGPNLLLLDLSQANVARELRAIYESEIEDFDPTGIKIIWRFPSGSTQIKCGDMSKFSKITSEDDDYLSGYNSYKGYYQEASQLQVTYYIAESFEPNNLQNTIICELTSKSGTVVEASKTFAFSTFGNSGTDYTLMIEGSGIVVDKPGYIAEIQPKLLDYDGNEVDAKFSLRWMGPALVSQDTSKENPYHLRNKSFNSETAGSILLVQTTADVKGRNVKLSTPFLPKLSQHENYSIQGPSYVIYNSHGVDPVYSKLPYVLYDELHRPIETTWQLRYFYLDNEFDLEEIMSLGNHATYGLDAQYLPRLKESTNELIVSPMYLGGMENYFFLLEALKDGHVYWSQAIYIGQNRYASNTLNDWDGKLDVNEESGTILAPLIAAGRKNSDNSFEGVVMGDVARYGVETADSITFNKGHPSTGTGLYGFHQGAQSFGFLTNGTAFIGKPGAGRLWFDGNKSQISNAGYYLFESDAERLGTELDLDDGTLHILSSGAEVYLGAKKRNNAYFSIRPRERMQQETIEKRSGLDPIQEKEIRQTIGVQKVVDADVILFEPTGAFLTLGLTKLKDPPYQLTGTIWAPTASDTVIIKYYKGSRVIQSATLTTTGYIEEVKVGEVTHSLYRIQVNEEIVSKYDSIVFECQGDVNKTYCRTAFELAYQDLITDNSYYNLERALINISDSASWIQTRGFEENRFVYADNRFKPADTNVEDIDLDLIQDTMGNGAQILLDTKAGIKAATFEIVSSNLVVTSQGDTLPYFGVFTPWINGDGELLKDTGGKPLIYISNNEYFLQSENYDATHGTHFNLVDGVLQSWNFSLQSANININNNEGGHIWIGGVDEDKKHNPECPLIVGNNFHVTANGHIWAQNADITGNVTATNLNIGPISETSPVDYYFKVDGEGNLNINNGQFTASKEGAVVANDITLNGGFIAGWLIRADSEIDPDVVIKYKTYGYLTSEPIGAITLSDASKVKNDGSINSSSIKFTSKPGGYIRLTNRGSINTVIQQYGEDDGEDTYWLETPLPLARWWITSEGEATFNKGITIANSAEKQDALLLVTHNDADGVFRGSGRIKFSALSPTTTTYEFTIGIDKKGDLSFLGAAGDTGIFYFNRSIRVTTDSIIFNKEVRNDAPASSIWKDLTLQSINGNVYIKSKLLEDPSDYTSHPGIYLNGQIYLRFGNNYVLLQDYIKYAIDGTEPITKIPIE